VDHPGTDAGGGREEGKIERGWRLTQVAWRLIREDRAMSILAFAGISSVFTATFLVFLFGGYFGGSHHSSARLGLVALIALYPATALGVFFNVALACAASAAFDGERMSAGEAMRIAWTKRRQVLGWSLLSAVVGVVISEIANRLPGGARLVGWLLGAAWSLATIFVVPILAIEGPGPLEAVKRSGRLVKQRWGEGLSGSIAIGAWSVVAAVPLGIVLGVGAALLKRHPAAGVITIGAALLGLVAVSTAVAATRQVFAVALYRYAIDAPIGGFAPADLEYPFTPRKEKRKSWILRIGGGFLAIFALLAVIVAIIGPPRRHTGAEGYFHLDFTTSEAATLSPGAPVVFLRRQIGTIQSTRAISSYVEIGFRVDPRFSEVVASHPAYVGHSASGEYLLIGPRSIYPYGPGGTRSAPGTL
jgi:uncharacterized protein DUF6159